MAKNYWLVKSEPETYSWDTFVKEGGTAWTGVRNFTARNNLRAMKQGDVLLFYHSVTEKAVVGLAKVAKEGYADTTAKEGDWTAVDIAPWKPLAKPVSLETIKTDKLLKNMELLRQGRLSVSPVKVEEFERLMAISKTK